MRKSSACELAVLSVFSRLVELDVDRGGAFLRRQGGGIRIRWRNSRPGHTSMLDGGVERKLWRKNYQEAKSGLKITEGLEQSLCKPALRKSFMSSEPFRAEGQKDEAGSRGTLILKACGSFHDRKCDLGTARK